MKREREREGENSTKIVDKKRKEKKQIKQWATTWKILRVRRQRERTQKETITLHSLCSQIYPWVDMLHEHQDIYSRWQTHTRKTKQNVKWASGEAHLAFLFVVVFFCALGDKRPWTMSGRLCSKEIHHTWKKTTRVLQKNKNHTQTRIQPYWRTGWRVCWDFRKLLWGVRSAHGKWVIVQHRGERWGLQLGDNPRSWEYINIGKDTVLLGVCEHTLNHTQVGVGGGHHKCEWCDARRMRKREEKDRGEIKEDKDGKTQSLFLLTWWLFGEGFARRSLG